jgi:ribosomal protein L17
MYKRNSIKKLGRTKSHRDSLIRNQIRSLLDKGSLKTTTPKAKVLRAKASKFLNRVSKLENQVIYNREVELLAGTGHLKDNIAKVIKSGNLGISVIKIGFRDGDNAEVSKVVLQGLVESKKAAATKKIEKKDKKKEVKKETAEAPEKSEIDNKGKKAAESKRRFTRTKERSRSRSGL